MKKGKKDEDNPHFPTFFTFLPIIIVLFLFYFFTLFLFAFLPFYLFTFPFISYLNPIFRLKLSGFSL